ncbi:MAG: aspartate aminotransferase family protein [Isosphaeraceae bacterium]
MPTNLLPNMIDPTQTTDEAFLRQIFVRDQMAEWSKQPLVMARADGVFYWDTEGKRYLDAISGIYVVSVGHNNRRVIEAIRTQLDSLAFSPPMHGTNPQAVQLANLLAELAPGDLSTVKFECGGAEVVEAAIKLARQYHKLTGSPGKYKILSRYQSWHGSTLGALSASGLKSRKTVNEPMAPGFLHVFPPTCYRCPFGKSYPDCGITCATIVGDVVEMEDPATVAAILVEPIGHTGGVIDPPEEYLPILREICDRHNILLIFDEIITGIGRTGRMFAAETFGVTPDVVCIAKGLSSGYAPLSAMICRNAIAQAFWGPISENPGFVEGHTFEGNPVSCAAGIAVLREILERDLLQNARDQGERLRRRLLELAGKYPQIGDVRGKGLFQAVEFVRDRTTRERFPESTGFGVRVGRRALANGLLCRFDPHWIAFGPPLVVAADEIDLMVAILDRSLGEVAAEIERAEKIEG